MDFRGHRNLKANKRTWLITKSRMGVDYLLQLASQAVKLVPFSWPGLARRYKSGQEPGELAAASPLPVQRVKWHQRQTYFLGEITRPLASSHSFRGTVIYSDEYKTSLHSLKKHVFFKRNKKALWQLA